MKLYERQFDPDLDFAFRAQGAERQYLIASTPRCGSHYLGHELAQTGDFGVPMEYLNKVNLNRWQARFGNVPMAALLSILQQYRTSASGWFGIKAHWQQFEPYENDPDVQSVLSPDRILWIYRRDLLKQAISFAIAEQTGAWISDIQSDVIPVYKFGRIKRAARNIRSQNRAWAQYLRTQDVPVQIIVYEDLIAGGTTALQTQASFLDDTVKIAEKSAPTTKRQGSAVNTQWHAQFLQEHRAAERWICEPQNWTLS